jgi:two-component system OmpR family sensor kinase
VRSPPFDPPPSLKRWSLAVTGVALATLPATRLAVADDVGTAVLEGCVPVLLVVGVTYAGVVYARGESPTFVATVTAWTLAVVAGMVVVALWIGTLVETVGPAVSVTRLAPIVTSVGAIVGLWLGTSNARWRERDAALRRERDRMAFLNELLRHHVLNAMQLVIGRSERLAAQYDGADRSAADGDGAPPVSDVADEIARSGRQVARRVEQLRSLAETDVQCWSVDLVDAVEESVAAVADRPDVEVDVDAPETAAVVGDDALPVLVEALLYHAVDRAGSDDVAVRVVVEGGSDPRLVVVDDAGPPPEGPVDPSIDPADGAFRFQLYLAATLVRRYGGDLSVETAGDGARLEASLSAPPDDDAPFGNP